METTKSPTSLVSGSQSLVNAQGELILRITGNSAQPETVSVRSSKCTIGSADACTIRLNDADVQPVHCIILRGTTETVVRRWADNVWLNGKHFDDATLAAGDVLTLANMQIEVVSDDRTDNAGALQRSIAAAESKVAQISQHTQVLNDRIRHLESAGSSGLSDAAKNELLVRLARLQDEKQELERRIAAQSVRHLDERRQWVSDLERFQAQVAKLQDGQNAAEQLDAAEQTEAALRQELEQLRSEIQQQQAELEAERARWQQATSERNDEENRQAADLQEQIAALEAKQAEFEQTKSDFEASQQTAQQELEQRLQELDARREEIESLSAIPVYDDLEAVPESGTADENAFPSQLIANTGPWQHELPDEPAAVEAAIDEERIDEERIDDEAGELAGDEEFGADLAEEELAASADEAAVEDFTNYDEASFEFGDRLAETANFEQSSSFDEELADAEYDAEFDEDEDEDEEFAAAEESDAEYGPAAEHEPEEAAEADEDDAGSELHEEISHLIEEESFDDDLMSYASQVADEVSGQVIDQRPEVEPSTELEEDWHLAGEEAVAAEFDPEPTAQHEDEIQAESFEQTTDDEHATLTEKDASSEFEESVAELEEAVADASDVDEESSVTPADDRSSANIEAVTEDWSEAPTDVDREADSESYNSPFESPNAEHEEAAAEPEPTESLADEAPAALAADSAEYVPAEDEMLARLQAMVDQNEPTAVDDATEANEPAAPVIDAESMLAELQAFDEDHPAESNLNEFIAETTDYQQVQQELASEPAASELEHETPASPAEVTYESVEKEDPGQLQTASLLSQFGIADELEDAVEDTLVEPAPELGPVPVVPQPTPDLNSAAEDDSIEDYMQQLMQRNSGGGNSTAQSTQAALPNVLEAQAAAAALEPKKPQRTPSRQTVTLDSLAKMRELANESNRSAIDRHAASSFRANAFSNLCFCGIAALAAAIFFVLSNGASFIWLLPALGSACASVYFGYKGLLGGTQSTLSGSSGRPKPKDEAVASAAAAGLAAGQPAGLTDDFTQPNPLPQPASEEPGGPQSPAFNDPLAGIQPGYEQATFGQQPQLNPAGELEQPYAQQAEFGQQSANHPFGQAPVDPQSADQAQAAPAPEFPPAEHPQPTYQDPQFQGPQFQGPEFQDPQFQNPGQPLPEQQYPDPQLQHPQYQDPGQQFQGQQFQAQQFQEQQHQNPQFQDPQFQDPQFQDPAFQAPQVPAPQVPGAPPPEYAAFPPPQYPGQTPSGLPAAPFDPNAFGYPQQPGAPQPTDPLTNPTPYGVDPTQPYPQQH
jgi:hypothetical protein